MKEAPTKNLPPKTSTGTVVGDGTPVKNSNNNNYVRAITNDEILSTLLRINNFDSISSIKDESLDIDLSACVTISDPSGIINGNSLSSSDFWRVLDESAQNPGQLDNVNNSYEGGSVASNPSNTQEMCSASNESVAAFIVKPERPSSFSGTFLRPDPPTLSISPLKKLSNTLPAEHLNKYVRKSKAKSTTAIVSDLMLAEGKKSKTVPAPSILVKQEPPEQLLDDDNVKKSNFSCNSTEVLPQMISKHSFSLFKTPVAESTKKNCESSQTPATPEQAAATTNAKNIDSTSNSEVNGSSSADAVVEELPAPAPDPLFKCEDCGGLLLQGRQAYAVHEALSHKILHKCSECPKEFENEASFKKHVKTHRTVESRKDAWKKCPDCGKCLKLGSMWMHRKIHSDNKKYGCDICGQKFVQKINLTHHSRVHTSEKPYECPECQKRFQERSHLQRHQKYHAQTRSYRCEKCGKMYKTERCLKVHNLVHLEQRPFACTVCDKSFISNSKLKQHSNIHTGERPFKCNYCPRDFTNFPNWLKHTRRRHKVDHKTGEHLENIPSYCSKKSAKSATAKVEKTQPSSKAKVTTSASQTTIDGQNISEAPVTKTQAKRKKKVTPQQLEAQSIVSADSSVQTELKETSDIPQQASVVVTSRIPAKLIKLKRERKQPTPKQVQKSSTPATVIKKEVIDSIETTTLEEHQAVNSTTTHFPDLHCLSITSAEELIMEQALEMEECGLYDTPATSTVVDTDNAVSAESAAALHFQIKREYIDIKEEFNSANNRLICSSLESSPYSSPASTSSALPIIVPTRTATESNVTSTTASSFYMPSFTLSPGSAVANSNIPTVMRMVTTENGIPESIQQQITKQQQQEQRCSVQPSAQALFSQLYVPIRMSMPLLMHPQLSTTQQVLPSVDTLIFTHSNSNFFRGKSTAQATAHNNL